ncbi:NAD-dependent protein deacylase sirtuin-5, mitochondrial-like [Pecten maximus]|uniref:NAD-dependent protein deacylase sirtuin-5, mitochondrial-like n=1 Tax=Pecten maximus TaxID=6579 RepID=UPI0014583F30|nr:NAD-dependent protein deacylase sirtuin-5, mitochondrial-like [Pecten maximus]XP_033752358.1 NAD-dependent protein deacylase sirtuin-5, mitochondrial-like [Pecten maximus]
MNILINCRQSLHRLLPRTVMAGGGEPQKDIFADFDRLGALLGFTKPKGRPSSNISEFREHFAKAKHIVVLTGAGVSAESGVPTFRGAGGYWRKWQAQQLATPEAFDRDPSLVWEFYHHRREVMNSKSPNKAHIAIAECEKRLAEQNRRVIVITQNIDELHRQAGTKNILELHGSLFKVRCVKCEEVTVNRDSPICAALEGKGEPNPEAKDAGIPVENLPRCKKESCKGLLRPHVVWFGESLDPAVLESSHKELEECDLCLVVGTSSVVYPAAMFAPAVASRGVPVAEINMEETDVTAGLGFHFQGPAGFIVPEALAKHESEP